MRLHDVKLRDRVGKEHPLKADIGCRNTLYNAVPQTAAEYLPRLLGSGTASCALSFSTTRRRPSSTLSRYIAKYLRANVTASRSARAQGKQPVRRDAGTAGGHWLMHLAPQSRATFPVPRPRDRVMTSTPPIPTTKTKNIEGSGID